MFHKQYQEEMMYRKNSETDIIEYSSPKPEHFQKIIYGESFEDFLTKKLILDTLFGWDQMSDFVKFCELMEKGAIKENDISKYDSWDMVNNALVEGIYKETFKTSKKEIHRIYDENGYLIFRPLTYNAAVYYGYQAKWCTSMINDPHYFYQHSRGVLVYVIDKNNKTKFGFHRHYDSYDVDTSRVIGIFNEKGISIDSYQTKLPSELLKIIMDEFCLESDNFTPNYEFFSPQEIINMEKVIGPFSKSKYKPLQAVRREIPRLAIEYTLPELDPNFIFSSKENE